MFVDACDIIKIAVSKHHRHKKTSSLKSLRVLRKFEKFFNLVVRIRVYPLLTLPFLIVLAMVNEFNLAFYIHYFFFS